ncbi:hypothetical protein C8R44DRAFT_648610 [Mycena epipterygia]|nr:hypothetical protein C8R44DRAFT_648610 [Mycena epipterygia]
MPAGYLFLCPLEDLRTKHGTHFRYPDCVAYWSFDASGEQRLSDDEAECHGFPSFNGFPNLNLSIRVTGKRWNDFVYHGIRQFHRAKGFGPDSQDVAQLLGCPSIQLSCASQAILAHGGCSRRHTIVYERLI